VAATRTKKQPNLVTKATVTAPVPGVSTRFAIVGGAAKNAGPLSLSVSIAKRGQYDIYYGMYREHPTVRAAVEKIAKVSVSNGYVFTPETPEDSLPKDKAKELRTFFRKSNASQLLRVTYKDLTIYGESFWFVTRTRNGKPLKAQRLHPKYVDLKTDGSTVTAYRYGPVQDNDKAVEYSPEVILHFKLDDPDNDLYGLSLLHSLQRTVATDLFAMEYNSNFFENSAQTGVIFNMKNSSTDEVDRNRAWLELNYVGSKNAHRPLILEGDISVQRSVSSPQEMQFTEMRKFNRQEILTVLDVPATKVAITEDANRSSSKEDDNTFRSETIAPTQLVVEEEINNVLILVMFGYDDILFKHREVSKRDQLELTKMFTELERMGVFSVNEVRGEYGMSDITGGDGHFIQTAAGLIPVALVDEVASRLVPKPQTGLGTDDPDAGLAPLPDPNYDPGAPAIGDIAFD
jgi:HK97 family phage portal protein